MSDPRLKQLKIKTGVVKRLAKEMTVYEKEVLDQEAKVDKMKTEKADEYDIRKQIEVLNESRAMVPDCKRRFKTAYGELKQLVDKETDLADNEDYRRAQEMLKDTALED